MRHATGRPGAVVAIGHGIDGPAVAVQQRETFTAIGQRPVKCPATVTDGYRVSKSPGWAALAGLDASAGIQQWKRRGEAEVDPIKGKSGKVHGRAARVQDFDELKRLTAGRLYMISVMRTGTPAAATWK